MTDRVEKVARAIDPIAFSATSDADGSLVSILRRDQAMKTAARAIAALAAAEAETPPVAGDPSRFSRLSPDERPVIRDRPDPTLGFISTAEMLASPSEAAIRADERETASPGPWPTEAEYELWQNDEFAAGASGSPEDAAREIMHYAAVYGQDGPVKIYEVKRYEVTPDALATAIRARGEAPPNAKRPDPA